MLQRHSLKYFSGEKKDTNSKEVSGATNNDSKGVQTKIFLKKNFKVEATGLKPHVGDSGDREISENTRKAKSVAELGYYHCFLIRQKLLCNFCPY